MSSSRTTMPAMLPLELTGAIFDAAAALAADGRKAFRSGRRSRRGGTLRPGVETPLWNTLLAEIRPHLRKHGTQANLGRLLGLQRQQINAFFVQRTRMPDAERTLQLIAWLVAVREGQPPA